MKIAIAGPGRSGTSVLVKLLGAWGFSIPADEGNWHDDAQAGLESRLGSSSPYEIDKDPWAYEYLAKLSDDEVAEYECLLVPIRALKSAATSRAVQERLSRPDLPGGDHWSWGDWGNVPGGAIFSTRVEDIEEVLARGLWQLLEVASFRGMNIVLLNFPRFTTDFDYLWAQLSQFVGERVTKGDAYSEWSRIVDPSLIRIDHPDSELSAAELSALLKQRTVELQSLRTELASVNQELHKAQIESLRSSRLSTVLRRLRVPIERKS